MSAQNAQLQGEEREKSQQKAKSIAKLDTHLYKVRSQMMHLVNLLIHMYMEDGML